MKKIDALINPAIKAVEKAKITKPGNKTKKDVDIFLLNDGDICKEFKGYISSFGAAVLQSGLLPALAFNHKTESGSKKDRLLLMNAIFLLLKEMRKDEVIEEESLFDYAKKFPESRLIRNQILDAATAIKLVIRTYNLV